MHNEDMIYLIFVQSVVNLAQTHERTCQQGSTCDVSMFSLRYVAQKVTNVIKNPILKEEARRMLDQMPKS